jgi:hypothetical protein
MRKFRNLFAAKKNDSVKIVAQRFRQAFQDHGVQISQIPRLIPQIKLENLNSDDSLLPLLSPEILDQTAKLFGIRIEWLEGVDDRIYEYLGCHKHPGNFFNHLISLNLDLKDPLAYPLRMLSTAEHLEPGSHTQVLAPVLVEKIAEIGDQWIYRYHIYQDGFWWDHKPARKELKALVRLYHNTFNEKPVPLCFIKRNEMDDLLEGKLIPRKFVDHAMITSPSMEDYALSAEESCAAKDVHELPDVLEYIKKLKLEKFLGELLQPKPPVELVLEPFPPVETIKREEPDIEQPPNIAENQLAKGLTKSAVINAFEGLYFDRDQWSKYLASPPKWLEEYRVARGNKKTSATWNPVLIAVALYDKNVPFKKLNAVFVRLADWAEEWRDASDSFR